MSEDSINTLFQSFNSTSKEDWLIKIEAELKGKDISSLNRHISDGFEISPFANHEDISSINSAINRDQQSNRWQVGSSILYQSSEQTNKEILKALELGVNAPEIFFQRVVELEDLKVIFNNVEHNYIETHLNFSNEEITRIELEKLAKYLSSQLKVNMFVLSFNFSNHSLIELYKIFKSDRNILCRFVRFPFKTADNNLQNIVSELVETFSQLNEYLKKGFDLNIPAERLAKACFIEMPVSDQFLTEISTFRAVRILWANMLKAYNLPTSQVYIKSRILEDNTEKRNENAFLVSAASRSASAIIGGADSVFISTKNKPNSVSYSNLLVKMQHIQKFESQLDQVIDPAAGSYYLEKLTNQLVERVWMQLIK